MPNWNPLPIFLCITIFPYSYAIYLPTYYFNTCNASDTSKARDCLTPVTTSFKGATINFENFTTDEGQEIVKKCESAKTCLSNLPCLADTQISKMLNVLCDVTTYYFNGYADCQKKMTTPPACMAEAHDLWVQLGQLEYPCYIIGTYRECIEKGIIEVCGMNTWKPWEKIIGEWKVADNANCTPAVPI
ncbi:hypothetical protein CRE_06159 [Caenorhabditis remanei]|uniref:T20D4.11-like domain-containing protein n=1 Tax=Caenorhabditis remanei TaxID=31234 RepID=E3NGW1_CAERE|nr:hypothetical protein CRE_06159 [Caenorhabditis remanei]